MTKQMQEIATTKTSGMMSLRKRTLFVIAFTLTAMMGMLLVFSQTIVKSGFKNVEDRDAIMNVGRVRDAFAMQIDNVAVKIIDWSIWDDAHVYMQDGNAEFEKSSLAVGALLGMQFELFAWRLPDGKIRWARVFDLEKETDEPLKPETIAYFDAHPELFTYKNEEDLKGGIMNLPGLGPIFFSIQPVVTSEGKGPIAGSMIAARAINGAMMEKLMKLTHLKLEIKTPDEVAKDRKFSQALPHLKSPSDTFTKAFSEQEISGFTSFNDFFGNPVAYVHMSTPREIHAQGNATIWSFMVALVIAGLIFGLVISFMLEKNVISRVIKLANTINELRTKSDLTMRVPVSGRDEITSLSYATNEMLSSIQKGQDALSVRNSDMKLILDNAEQGFLNVNLDGSIAGERSSVVDKWLGSPKAESRIWDYFFSSVPKTARIFKMGWEQLVEDIFPFEVSAAQMPSTMVLGKQVFEITLRPVYNQGVLYRVLAVISDVTARIEAEKKSLEQKEMVKVFQLLLADRASLMEFFEDSADKIKQISSKPQMDRALQMRHIHTLKGNAAQYGIETFAGLCHILESKLMESDANLSTEDRERLQAEWQRTETRLGPLLERGRSKQSVEISKSDFDDLIASIKRKIQHEQIDKLIASWELEPLNRRFARLAKTVEGLAERLGKETIEVTIQDNGLRTHTEEFSDFWSGIVHTIRNAVDHGIESAEERKKLGKPKGGRVTFAASTTDSHFLVEISDDGRGIDWNAIKLKAKTYGMPCDSKEDLTSAMFTDGISTKETVTEVSGRGVGMAVIKAAVEELGGFIQVHSEMGKGTRFTFLFPISRIRLAKTIQPLLEKAA